MSFDSNLSCPVYQGAIRNQLYQQIYPIRNPIYEGAVAKSSKSEMMIERQLFFPSKNLTKSIFEFHQVF